MAHSFRRLHSIMATKACRGSSDYWWQKQEAEAVHVAVSQETGQHFKLGMGTFFRSPLPAAQFYSQVLPPTSSTDSHNNTNNGRMNTETTALGQRDQVKALAANMDNKSSIPEPTWWHRNRLLQVVL